MGRVLTENQELLKGYLLEVGCSKIAVLVIILDVWEPEETLDMLQFCKENHGTATEKDFVAAAKEISVKKEKRTIEDVWNIEDGYAFLRAMNLYLSIKCNYGDEIKNLNEEEKTFFCVQIFEEYILDGSFTGFFFNSCGDFANEIVPALKRVGAIKMAEICEKAFSIYGDKVPMVRDERKEIYNSMGEIMERVVDECQNRLSDCNNNLPELCYQFILSNKESFSK